MTVFYRPTYFLQGGSPYLEPQGLFFGLGNTTFRIPQESLHPYFRTRKPLNPRNWYLKTKNYTITSPELRNPSWPKPYI